MRERLLVFLLACGDLVTRRHMGYGYQVDSSDDPACCDDSQDPVGSARQFAGRQLLLQANSQLREAALDEHLSGASESSPSCGWVVHYNRWEPTFDKGEFEHNDALGGAHCLDACCRDPSCLGLTLESSEKYQCYKYSTLPTDLEPSQGVRLGDAEWLLRKDPAWSIFVKANAGSEAWRDALPTPRITADSALPSVRASAAVGKQNLCQWAVHYDKWMPSFEPGEYEHNDALGGAHCLEACCQDPTCQGLQLESIEKYQCYKYSSLPAGLDTLKGKPLGDAKWLLSKTPTWSVFVKTVVNKGGDSRHTWQPEVAGRRAAAEKANATALSRSRGLWEATASHTVLHRPVLAQLWGIGSLSAVILIVLYICVSDNRRTATQLLYSIGGPSHDPERKSLLAEMKSLKLTAP
mmetsp:Transcript_52434/g.86962  ORF Transcript_52434/g.86962 Transcript_52434/m.86962 type:complete len:408 (-) Transcript_52434:93-1316(-)